MEKLLFIAPHLSTGGLPQVLVNKIELLKNDYIIKCVEWDWTGDAFVIQKNRVKEHIGPENLITLGEDKTKLFDIISDFNPDLICLEEFCEHFIPEEINKKLFSKDRSYKLFETTHDSSIPVTNKRWFPDKFIFVSPFNAFRYSMFDVPYDIIEYPIDAVTPNKEWAQEQLMLDPNFKHVVIVGLFTERKNQAYAFEMARRVIGQNILFHFIGNQADNFAHYWLPLMGNKPGNCIVWGERNDVDTFLQASDLFLFPSKGDRNNKELNPIAIKEAIKYELPMMMFNLDVYCGKYNNNQKIKFMSGDITQDTNTLLGMLGKNDILSLFSLSYESNENKINIHYNHTGSNDINVVVKCMTSNAPMYWFNLNFTEPLTYFVIPIPTSVMKFEGMKNFRGFSVEFYSNGDNTYLGKKEVVVNNVYPNIPRFNFKPFDCNYVNYHEFFIDKCFSGLGLENLDTVIDIGANVGLFAKYMYSINTKKVILVEANPYLRESIETLLDTDNEKSVIYMNPIYGEKTTIPFRFSMENTTIGSNYFGTDHDSYSQLTNVIDCETITLDEILKDNNYERISLLKCDIEGGEYPFFESVTDEQIQLVDRFMIEFHGNVNHEIDPILEKLERNDYEYEIILFEMGRQIRSHKGIEHGVIFAKPKSKRDKKPGSINGSVYQVTKDFEQALCDYTGAPYAVTVDNQSNALFLALMYEKIKGKTIRIPSRTYPSVPCEIIHAGGKVEFEDFGGTTLKGAYQLQPTKVWDSALRFTSDMYIHNSHMCLSFTGPYKHLKLGKGGAILTDDYEAYKWFKRARYSGRNECSYHEDELDMLGWNFYMLPELASRGLLLMNQFYKVDGSPKHNEDLELPYPDLSKFDVYKK
jgi:glycosyltransferase involved in cell wall biosynthesis